MSYGPPLNMPSSASGISLDPQTLERVVAGTRRKDGSVRKELKVRPGFTPEEDKVRYRSIGARETNRLKGYVPGATNKSSATYQSTPPDFGSAGQFPTLTAAQKKNQKRSAKKKLEKETEGARNWDSEEEDEEVPVGDTSLIEAPVQLEVPVESTSQELEDDNLEAKSALRHLLQQNVTNNPPPSARPEIRTSSTSWRAKSNTEEPIKERKAPRPGGLFAAALNQSKQPSSSPIPTENLSTAVSNLAIDDQPRPRDDIDDLLDGTEYHSPSALTLQTPIKTKDATINTSASPKSTPPNDPNQAANAIPSARAPLDPARKSTKPLSPGASAATGNNNNSTANKKANSSHTPRPEVRVRPGHGGLAGMLKQISAQNAK